MRSAYLPPFCPLLSNHHNLDTPHSLKQGVLRHSSISRAEEKKVFSEEDADMLLIIQINVLYNLGESGQICPIIIP